MYFRERNRFYSIKTFAVEFPFLEDGLNIGTSNLRVARNAIVATAVSAERTAERNMHVDGRSASLSFGINQTSGDAFHPVVHGRIGIPVENRRVARITRPLNVIFPEKNG